MFADPQTITVSGVAKSMARVKNEGLKSTYQTNDGIYTFTISHLPTKDKIRTLVRIDFRTVVADPLTAVNDYETLTTYFVVERPVYGFTLAQLEAQIAAFETWLDATSIGKLFGQES